MIDAHCHLDLYQYPEEVALETEKNRITTIAVTNLPSHFVFSTPYVRRYKNIHLALGMHPLFTESHSSEELTHFKGAAKHTLFIGEVGLDFSIRGKATYNQQLNTFQEILRVINDRPRFISIHARGAEKAVIDLLDRYQIKNAVFHWYSGPVRILEQITSKGHYLSVNPGMIISKKGQAIIERIPKENILTETDGPYLQIKGRPAQPKDISLVIEYLANLWRTSQAEVENQVESNFKEIITRVGNL